MRRALPLLALAFCAGAALRFVVRIPDALALAAVAALGVALVIAGEDRPRLGAILALALMALAGAGRTGAWLRLPENSVAHLADRRWARLHGVIVGEAQARPWGAWLDLSADRAETRREPLAVSGRVRVYLPPGAAAPYPYGSRVAVEGRVLLPDDAANPGEIPPAQYLRRDGIVAVLSARAIRQEPGRGASPLVALALRSRHMLERGIAATLPPRDAGLLAGLLFSDTGALPEGARDDFARAGTVHILSTSGLHVALLAGLMALLFPARRPGARRARNLLLLFALLFFALMTGLRPAVTRAVLMTGAVLAAPLFEREADVWCALAMAALALVAHTPGNLLDPGFQLSFAAALALALFFAPASRAPAFGWRRLPGWARASAQTSTVAALATAPLAARYFGVLSLAAPLSNLLVVPLVAPAMALGLLQGLLWPLAPGFARLAGMANRQVLDAILGLTSGIAARPWSAMDVGPPPAGLLLLVYSALGLWLAGRLSPALRKTLARPVLVPALASAVALFLGWRAWGPPPPLRVTFLDVGQGDAALIRTPRGRALLIDTGGRYEDAAPSARGASSGRAIGERVVVPALRRAGVCRLDALVLTHPHEDHAGGLPSVLSAFPVGLWLDSGQAHAAPGYMEGLKMARVKRVPVRRARAGQRLALEPGLALEVVAPRGKPFSGTRDDLNNNGIVCRLVYRRTAVLFCGDIEREAEERLLRSGADLRADLLKVGHHGGSTSAGMPLLAAVRPSWAVVSCGRHNRYGHPAEATLARLMATGARVFRTDRDGAVTVESDGGTLRVRTARWLLP